MRVKFKRVHAAAQFVGSTTNNNRLASACATLAAVSSLRRVHATRTEERQLHGLKKLVGANDAVTAATFASARRIASHLKRANEHGRAAFQHIDVSESRVRHVHMHRTRANRSLARTSTTAERFIDAETRIAKEHIVHGALTLSAEIKRFEQSRDDALACFDIARNDWWTTRWIRIKRRIEKTFRKRERDRTQQAFVHRDGFIDQESQRIQRGRLRDGARRIEIRAMHWRATCEVDVKRVVALCDSHADG